MEWKESLMLLEMFDTLLGNELIAEGLSVQQQVLQEFHARAERTVAGSCRLRPYGPDDFILARNLFSTLFLATQACAGLEAGRRLFYGLINQCMRAWVTGCDNLLDDEFKSVIPFDLSDAGYRARSVLTIMTADRICGDLLFEEIEAGRATTEQASQISHNSLKALVASALQEHDEEAGAAVILPPNDLIEQVHVPKTGLLFEAPITVPEHQGDIPAGAAQTARVGLRAFGLGCQILDDLVDYPDDLRLSHHNFILSLAVHGDGSNGAEPMARESVEIDSLEREEANRCAATWAARYFNTARRQLLNVGLVFTDGQWQALVGIVAMLLRTPPQFQTAIEEAL
jgi:hypothetical protein